MYFYTICKTSKLATKKGLTIFWKKRTDAFVYTLRARVADITLSCTFSEINAFLHFMQKFNMVAKNGGRTFFNIGFAHTPWEKISP